jgi:choline dehydrogenase-like flavoprotein
MNMSQAELYQDLVLGSGAGGKLLAWHLARSGRRVAVVERRWIGGSCPNINCLPSKNEIWSAKVADLVHDGASFGAMTDSAQIDMAKVRPRKRKLENSEPRSAPETRVQRTELPEVADRRPVPANLTCRNVGAFPFWAKLELSNPETRGALAKA